MNDEIPVASSKQDSTTEHLFTLEKSVSDFLMQLNTEPILILNTDFTISQANPAFLRHFGKTGEDVIGRSCHETIYGYPVPCPEAHPEFKCPMVETLKTGESARVIHETPPAAKDLSYSNVVSYPVKDKNGRVQKVIEIWQDITRDLLINWEKQSRKLKEDLNVLVNEDRMASLGKLAASCVHEINNPIQGLLTFSHLLEEILSQQELSDHDIGRMRHYTALMSSELDRCGNITTGLLSFARETPGEFCEVVVNDVLSSVLALTRHKMTLQQIRLEKRIEDRRLLVNGDGHQFQQCFLNLVFNAMEAMPEGGTLTVAAREKDKGKTIEITFGDTGYGIPQTLVSKIFDPFFTTKAEGKGTGLGLSIVYGIVKKYGGDITVKSSTGKGSVFVMKFPAASHDPGKTEKGPV
jgi:two-component system, NtrC family, sensor kinase